MNPALPAHALGIGLRPIHYAAILEGDPPIDFFEILSENYMDTGGRPVQMLDRIAARHRVVMHGVAMNVAGTDPLDRSYLRDLRSLQRRCGALWISDHLCWTAVDGVHLHDLLPIPYTEATLRHVAARVRTVQDCLEQPLVLENPSTYLEFAPADCSEVEFLTALVAATGCRLLVDVNNVAVSCHNHGHDPEAWLCSVPWSSVAYLHVAGHSVLPDHRLDTHDAPVSDPVWALHALAQRLSGGLPTVLERDDAIPPLPELVAEFQRARRPRASAAAPARSRQVSGSPLPAPPLRTLQRAVAEVLRARGPQVTQRAFRGGALRAAVATTRREFAPRARLQVYAFAYRTRLIEVLAGDYPAVKARLGDAAFARLARRYLTAHPSRHPNLAHFGAHFPRFLRRAGRVPALAIAIARLELAITQCFDAPAAAQLDPRALAHLSPAAWRRVRLGLDPSVRILRLPRAAVDWQRQWRSGPMAPARSGNVDLLLFRRDGQVRREEVAPDAAAVLRSIARGERLADAVAHAAPDSPVGAWFAQWRSDGLLAPLC